MQVRRPLPDLLALAAADSSRGAPARAYWGGAMLTPAADFRAAIGAAGLTPPETIEADGLLHRFQSNGKRGDDSGWYVFYGDGLAAGAFGCWRAGVNVTWRATNGHEPTPAEEAVHRARVAEIQAAREADQAKLKAEAAKKARAIWQAATPAAAHPYLERKRVQAHGARTHKAALIIGMEAGGVLHSLQFIAPDGEKRFLTGGRVAGCSFAIGEARGAATICLCEGFATAASVHEATGYPAMVAFTAGNLEAVAKEVRHSWPAARIVVCADDDYRTAGNPGVTKATEAARAVGGFLAVPAFGANRPDGATDFNDLAGLLGLAAVAEAVERAEAAESEAAPAVPAESERPCFRAFDGSFEAAGVSYRAGVWHFGIKHGRDGEATLTQQWICSPLHVNAVTSDGRDNNFGRLLRFKNTLGRWREWGMPMELLGGKGDELRAELLAMGLHIDPSAHRLLGLYLQARTPARRMLCALQVGWCGGSFVLPDAVIGPDAGRVIFQSGDRGNDEFTTAGTLDGWRTEVAARAIGNPVLLLALSAAFAGPLLARCHGESGGIHLFGDSSTGKTTAVDAACSVFGGASFKRSWRATSNGMEGVAALFNDTLLALDEISEADAREVSAIVYALGNGRGKQRASRTGAARSVTRWRCMVVSDGERTIGTHMLEAGIRAKAGQSVRLLDVPAARKHGVFDELHGCESGAALSDAIKRAALTHHGHAGRAYLEKLTRDGRNIAEYLEAFKATADFAPADGEGQDRRAAARFALIGMAGELATEYGLSGWPEGAAIEAAAECFTAWRTVRGKGNNERRQILDRVAGFIERHGDGRFSDANGNGDNVRDRAGWWRDTEAGREFLFTKDGMREALKGHDFERALDVLELAGALPPRPADGRRARPHRIGNRAVRVYSINADRLAGDHGA